MGELNPIPPAIDSGRPHNPKIYKIYVAAVKVACSAARTGEGLGECAEFNLFNDRLRREPHYGVATISRLL